MIDRLELVRDVKERLANESAADEIVDEVLIPALTAYLAADERERTILLVDAMSASSQAAIARQRATIDRLLDKLSGSTTVDPGR